MLFLDRRHISCSLAVILASLCAATASHGQSMERSVNLEWDEPPYVPEGEDPDSYQLGYWAGARRKNTLATLSSLSLIFYTRFSLI